MTSPLPLHLLPDTAAVGADIVTFARTRGLFAGLSLEGSILTYRSAENRAYYGRDVSARGLVVSMEAHNPGADPLRAVLLRYGADGGAAAPAPMAAAPPLAGRAPPPGRVAQEALPLPPRR